MWKWYMNLLAKKPLPTQMISSGLIGLTGDGICQLIVEKRTLNEYDPVRASRFFLIPCFFNAPILNRWFLVLERVKGTPRTVPLKRVFIDQVFMAPILGGAILFNIFMVETRDPNYSWEKVKALYPSIWKRSIQFWPAVQLLNFYLMPFHFRLVFVQLAAVFWNTYLSFRTQHKPNHPVMDHLGRIEITVDE